MDRNRQVAYNTIDNEQVFYTNNINYPLTRLYSNIALTNRYNLYNTQILQLTYNQYIFNDSLNKLNKNYSFNNNNPHFIRIEYTFINDHRDSRYFPLKGYFYSINLLKLGITSDKNNPNLVYLHTSIREYWQIGDKYYIGSGINTETSNTDNSHIIFQQA